MLLAAQIILDYPKNNTEEERFIAQGDIHVEKKEYAEALKCYNTALNICATHRYALLRRADIYFLQSDIRKAFDEYLELEKNANNTELREPIYLRLGLIFFATKNLEKALEYFSKVIAINEENDVALQRRGEVNLHLNQIDDAQLDLNCALQTNPNNFAAWWISGFVGFRLNEYLFSISCFDRLIDKPDFDQAEVYYYCSYSYERIGDHQSALSNINKAITHSPTPTALYYSHRAEIQNNLNNFNAAIQDFSEAILLNDKDPTLYVARGKLHLYLGHEEAALDDFSRALEIAPNEPDGLENRLKLLYRLGECERALLDINLYLSLFPNSPKRDECLVLKVKSLTTLNQLEDAEVALKSLNKKELIVELQTIIDEKKGPQKSVSCSGKTYVSRGRRPSLLFGEGDKPLKPTRQMVEGFLTFTRVFVSENNPKQPQRIVKAMRTNHPLEMKELYDEVYTWNTFYPQHPAQLFPLAETDNDNDNDYRLSLPYFPGVSLLSFIKSYPRPLALAEFYQIWLAIAIELYRLHELGIIHGDFKKANVLIVEQRVDACFLLRLIDFGKSLHIDEMGLTYTYEDEQEIPSHFAPEWYTKIEKPKAKPEEDPKEKSNEQPEDTYITVHPSSDVYNISAEILDCKRYFNTPTLPEQTQQFFHKEGCAKAIEERPSMQKIIVKLWNWLLECQHQGEALLTHFINTMEPASFKTLSNFLNSAHPTVQDMQKPPAVVTAIRARKGEPVDTVAARTSVVPHSIFATSATTNNSASPTLTL